MDFISSRLPGRIVAYGSDGSLKSKREAINTLLNDGFEYGLDYHSDDDGFYIGLKHGQMTVLPYVLSNMERYPSSIFVDSALDGCVHFVIKIEHKIYEYVIEKDNAQDSSQYRLLGNLLSIYEKVLADVPVFINGDYNKHGDNIEIEFMQLPFNYRRVVDAEWPRLLDSAQGRDLKKALKEASFFRSRVFFLSLCLLVSLSLLFFVSADADDEVVVLNKAEVIKESSAFKYSGLEGFYTGKSVALKKPSFNVYRKYIQANQIKAWDVKAFEIEVDESGALFETIHLVSDKGDVKNLSNFISEYGYGVNVNGNDAYLKRAVLTEPVFSDFARFHIGTWSKYIGDALSDWWDYVDLNVDTVKEYGSYRVVSINGAINNAYPEDLINFVSLLHGKPFSLKKISLIKESNGKWMFHYDLLLAGVDVNVKE